MKMNVTKLAAIVLFGLCGLMTSCVEKAEREESYGSNETSENETPTTNDEATKDTVIRETGPGSATVGDTANRTPPNR